MGFDFLENFNYPYIARSVTDFWRRWHMDDAMIAAIRKSGVRQILYVSCNPATLGRNLNDLADLYTVKKIQPYDLFPQTPHVETLTVLERRTR